MEEQIQLVKKSESFDLVITDELEKKIRFLCDKLPKNEYSGTLFYSIDGSFKDKNLVITAKDFFLQDVGEAAYTEFQNDVSLACYMATHALWDCYTGLMHSHNSMSAFLSGTDVATLLSEGKEANHFVSLIVNNEGKYCAAITRKVNYTIQGSSSISYNTFNDEQVSEGNTEVNETKCCVEYYNLRVLMPEGAPKSELELRLEEVKKNAQSYINRKTATVPLPNYMYQPPYNSPKVDMLNELHDIKKEPKEAELFPEVKEIKEEECDIPYGKVHVRKSSVDDAVLQIVTGDLFSIYKQTLKLDSWMTNMSTLYDKRFGSPKNENFKYWVDNVLDFLVGELYEPALLEEGDDYMWAIWAYDVIEALETKSKELSLNEKSTQYLNVFIKSLERWLI